MSYRIKTVADMTGIPRNTILAWERRYSLFAPGRTPGGYRVFVEADVALLRQLKELVDQGYKISEAIALSQERALPSRRRRPAMPTVSPLRSRLLHHLVQFDRSGADRLRGELGLLSFRQQLDEVFLPLLAEVGEAWADGEVSVAQEHFVAAFCREQMIAMFHSLDAGPEQGPEAVCAGFPGEQHELGLLGVAIKLALAGYRVSYLGADLPTDELVKMLALRPCRLVCQSIVQVRDVDAVLRHLTALRQGVRSETRIAVGGAGAARLAEHGIDGVTLCDTVEEILRLLPPKGD